MGCAQSEIAPQNETPKKGCTDVLWLILYIVFWIIMLIIACISFVYGNPQRLLNGYDSYGNTCGVKNNQKLLKFPWSGISTEDKSYLFFMDVKELRRSLKICVKKCPDRTMNSLAEIQQFYRETGSNICNYGVNLNAVTSVEHTFYGPCPALPVYESYPVINRCVPKKVSEQASKVLHNFYELLNSWDNVEQMLSDIYNSWKEMIICVIVAFLMSLLMVSVLHWVAKIAAAIFMLLVSIASVAGTALLWHTYWRLRTDRLTLDQYSFLAESLKNEKAFLVYSIIATIITVILLILVFVMRSRVSFLAALFAETAHCLGALPALFLQPVITFLFLVILFAFWSTVVVCLATSNLPTSHPGVPFETNLFFNSTAPPDTASAASHNASNRSFILDPLEFDPLWVKSMWWLCLICLVWGSEFVLGCQQMTIAGAVSHWYFRGENAHSSPVLYSVGKLVKYHLGSVAKGSFLITLFKIPRLILTYLHAKLSSRAEKGNECAKCGLKCGICCFYCFEKFIRYLNHNAYTIITIDRCHFCKAAAKAFSVIVNNALQVATINSVGDFILFLGKCVVTAVSGSVGLLLLRRNSELHFYAVPTLLICVYSFFIAHCILSLYEMVVDALFICVCEDRARNPEGHWQSTKIAELGGHKPRSRDETDQGNEMENLQEK